MKPPVRAGIWIVWIELVSAAALLNTCVEMTCCPPNSLPYLAPDYNTKGSVQSLPNGYEYYTVGSAASKKALLIVPDIFGWNG